MTKNSFKDINPESLTVRERLALERTGLANERTLLSYVRTMFAFAAVGGTLIKFFTEWYFIGLGVSFMFMGIAVLVLGFNRYIKMYVYLNSIDKSDTKEELQSDPLQQAFWTVLEKLHLTA